MRKANKSSMKLLNNNNNNKNKKIKGCPNFTIEPNIGIFMMINILAQENNTFRVY